MASSPNRPDGSELRCSSTPLLRGVAQRFTGMVVTPQDALDTVEGSEFCFRLSSHGERALRGPGRGGRDGALDRDASAGGVNAGAGGTDAGAGETSADGDQTALRATYRLQLNPAFGFAAARELVPYLRDLGISHLYLSPSLQACAGSEHGYNIVDPRRLSDELGGEAAFRELAAEARAAGMGIVLDVVPNHMAADDANRFWADPVLREKFFDLDPAIGRHRRFFDIDELAGVRVEDTEVF